MNSLTPPTPVIEVRQVRKVYKSSHGNADHVAVEDLSFTLEPAGALGIVGESGAGKTTVASMLMGFEVPTSGSILFNGEPLHAQRRSDARRRAREIQIVFQDPYSSLDPRQPIGRAIEEVLAFHFALKGSERRARAMDLLGTVGLSPQTYDLRPRALSGGQCQRVAIARALAVEPNVLILDESVAALDVSIQAQVLNLLDDLRSRLGTAYIFISHDLGVIRYTTDSVIVMERGKLVEAGATTSVLDHPQDEYTRRLRNSVPRPGWVPARAGTAG